MGSDGSRRGVIQFMRVHKHLAWRYCLGTAVLLVFVMLLITHPSGAQDKTASVTNKLRGNLQPSASSDLLPSSSTATLSPGVSSLLTDLRTGDDSDGALLSAESGRTARRQERVVAAFRHAWQGYAEFAFGKDELHPLSQTGGDWFGLGLTLLDALDTMVLMGLDEEYTMARSWVVDSLRLEDTTKDVNLFETTIRVMGGLLSAHALTGDAVFLQRAETLGDRMSAAFDTPSGIPYSDVNLHSRAAHGPKRGKVKTTTAEATTLQLEWRYLSNLTGRPEFRMCVDRVNEVVAKQVDGREPNEAVVDSLVPKFIDPKTGRFESGVLTLGARGDSYYEYLLKQWLQTGKSEPIFREQYLGAMRGVMRNMLHRSEGPLRLLYVAELPSRNKGKPSPKMDHLVCFLPGLLALGWDHGVDGEERDVEMLAALGASSFLDVARELMHTCYMMYALSPTKLAAEISHFRDAAPARDDLWVKKADARNLLRPETVESLFVLWRVTGEQQYREWGWEIFEAFETHCKVDSGGFASLDTVLEKPPKKQDKMESFFLAETLKYLFLLFSDAEPQLLPLDRWVFNTEASVWAADNYAPLCASPN